MRRGGLPGVAIACAALLTATAGVAAASTATWTVMPTPASDGVSLAAVSCPTGGYCLAVGHSSTGPAVYVWHGSTWSSTAVPSDVDQMHGLACSSATSCIAVGSVLSGDNERAAAWSWNGSKWTTLSPSNPKSAENVLAAIRCASATSCESVGEHGAYPLAESWNGKSWTLQSTTGAPAGDLNSVSCESAGACVAVGFASGETPQALAMRLDGTKWVTASTPDVSPSALTSVSCYSSGCVAVGSSGGEELLSELWNGSSWSVLSEGAGQPGGASLLEWNGVHCQSASNCTAIGYYQQGSTPYSLADAWNGSTWTIATTPNPSPTGDLLDSVSCTSGGSLCTAAGAQASSDGTWNSLAMRN